MPSLTTREVARRKREHGTIRDSKWYSNGHAFCLQYCDALNGWIIRGGCREWRSLSEALDHYHFNWCPSDSLNEIEKKRLERRRIVRSIARFAKKHKFRMAGVN
jgi:hypothetical protein